MLKEVALFAGVGLIMTTRRASTERGSLIYIEREKLKSGLSNIINKTARMRQSAARISPGQIVRHYIILTIWRRNQFRAPEPKLFGRRNQTSAETREARELVWRKKCVILYM
jgi:hypothetical protein